MKKLKLNYTCTDPDCAQYMAKVTDTRYSYIEYREWFGNYIVCHAVVDLQDYTLDEICTYCSSYYASLEQMVADYGFRGALQIMAECIFEQLGFDDLWVVDGASFIKINNGYAIELDEPEGFIKVGHIDGVINKRSQPAK